jgi:hypothetical protein
VAGFPGDGNVTFGINNKNQVAFARLVEGVMHAHVFLPLPDYGLAAGVYDLHVLGDAPQNDLYFGENDASIATDISDDGIVVGASGESFNRGSLSVARIWRLDQASVSPISVPTRSIQSTTISNGSTTGAVLSSVAHAVTEGVPGATGVTVRIVGEVWVDACDEGYPDPHWGFTVTIPGGSNPAASSMNALRPSAGSRVAFATDVNSPGGLPVGWDAEEVTELCPECPLLCQPDTACASEDPSTNEPLMWPGAGTTATGLGLLPDPVTADQSTRAIGLNDAGQVVGWGYLSEVEGPGCREWAAFWAVAAANQVPLVLGLTMPAGQASDRSIALAINEPDGEGCVTIAGINLSAIRGMIWHGDGEDFCAADLDALRVPCDGLSPIVVRQAHDINDGRFVVGIGSNSLGFRAIALTAGADINRDFVVDGADLGLLANGATCGSCWSASGCIWCDSLDAADLDGDGNADCFQCPTDLDCDGDTDSADLGILLSQWGTVAVQICDCGTELDSFASGGAESSLTVDEAIESLGFADFAAFAEWGSTATQAQLEAAALTLKALMAP